MKNELQIEKFHVPSQDNLIKLGAESKAVKQAIDINSKIDSLEINLSTLQSELDAVNNSVDEGLVKLIGKDLDLTTKVSETYKRLGEVNASYKTLSSISANIDTELKNLTLEVSEVAEQSTSDLEKMEQTSSAQHSILTSQHDQLILRVNSLVNDSRKTNDQLTISIKNNTEALLTLEKQVIADIDTLANTTEQRDNELATDLDSAKEAIESGKAIMLQMQAVDETLEKRATALEKSTAELGEISQSLYKSVNLLNDRTNSLSQSVKKLQEQSDEHTSLISKIQINAKQMANSLLILTSTEKKHFKLLSAALAMALLIIAGLHLYQESVNSESTIVTAERTQTVDQNLSNVTNDLVTLNDKFKKEVISINKQLQNTNDQLLSLDGRLNYISPSSRTGKDGVIHGSHWLAEQQASNLAIEITSTNDRDELLKIAQRYSHYFKHDLSYYSVNKGNNKRYILVYGNFNSNYEASSVLHRLPYYINFQRPSIRTLGEIQKQI